MVKWPFSGKIPGHNTLGMVLKWGFFIIVGAALIYYGAQYLGLIQ